MALPAFVRTHRNAVLGGLALAGFVGYQVFWPTSPAPVGPLHKEERVVQASVDDKRTLHGQVDQLKETLDGLAATQTVLTKSLQSLRQEMSATTRERAQHDQERTVREARERAQQEERLRSETATRERAWQEKLAQQGQAKTAEAQRQSPRGQTHPASPPTPPAFELRTLGSSQGRPKHAPAPLVHHVDASYLPAACIAKITLVTGVSASSQLGGSGGASWGNPILYVIRETFTCARQLDEIGAVALRQKTGVPLDGCMGFATGKADLASSRVQGEAILLSCVMPDGEAYEVPMKGYLVGKDGKQGIFGTIQTHESAKVGKAFIAGMIEEAAAFFSAARRGVTISVSGQSTPYGGMETTLRKVADYWLEQARALQPTLDIEANTPAYLVTLQGVALEGLHRVNWLRTGAL